MSFFRCCSSTSSSTTYESSITLPVIPKKLRTNPKTSKMPKFHWDFSSPVDQPQNTFEEELLLKSVERFIATSRTLSSFMKRVKKSMPKLPIVKIVPRESASSGALYNSNRHEIWLAHTSSTEIIISSLIFEYCNAKRRKAWLKIAKITEKGHFRSAMKYAEAIETEEYNSTLEYMHVWKQFLDRRGLSFSLEKKIIEIIKREGGAIDPRDPIASVTWEVYWKTAQENGHAQSYINQYNEGFANFPRTCTCEDCEKEKVVGMPITPLELRTNPKIDFG